MKQLLTYICLFVLVQMKAQNQFTVYFDFDIDEADTNSNNSLLQWTAKHSDAHIKSIFGYTDSIGTPSYNNGLSKRRATSIYNQLKNTSVFLENAEVKGLGETVTEADAPKNRKVVITFIAQKESPVTNTPDLQEPKPQPTYMPVLKTLDEQISGAKKGDKIVLQNIIFYYDSPLLLPESAPMLDKLVYILKIDANLKIDIQGHKCCSPSDVTNLSGDRAKSVYQYLVNHGVDKNRLSYQGFGTNRPIYSIPEKTEAQREANRRVEIEVLEN
jgi:outer membrane protein OmpA-like peptidoglycan-associated protein